MYETKLKEFKTTVIVRGKNIPCNVVVTSFEEDDALSDAFPEESDEILRIMYNKLNQNKAEWVSIQVNVTALNCEGTNSLGGCWLEKEYTFEQVLEEHGMIDNAIRELSSNIENLYINMCKIFEGETNV